MSTSRHHSTAHRHGLHLRGDIGSVQNIQFFSRLCTTSALYSHQSVSQMHWPIHYTVHHIVNECIFWICPQCSERNMNLWILQVTKPFHLCMSEGLNMDAVCCLEAILSSFFNLKINFPKSDEHKRRDEGNQMSTRKMLNTLRQRWDNNSNFLLLWNVRKTLKYEKLIHSYVNMSVYCVLLYPLICCDKDRLELLPLHDT